MVLIITNNKETKRIVSKYINIKDCLIDELEEDFSIYIDRKLMNKNLEQFDKIIIDITNFKEKKDEILKSITRIKVIYNIQIIIIALNYKVGDELLSNLFDIGIYDFIISSDKEIQREEWIKALNENNYIDAVKFKKNIDTVKKKKKKISKMKLKKKLNDKQDSKKILDCFFMLKNKFISFFEVVGYIIITILVSVGATALLNSNIRQMIIDILRGGK